jgi:hypothetical protein
MIPRFIPFQLSDAAFEYFEQFPRTVILPKGPDNKIQSDRMLNEERSPEDLA